jgi:hypothetical protein
MFSSTSTSRDRIAWDKKIFGGVAKIYVLYMKYVVYLNCCSIPTRVRIILDRSRFYPTEQRMLEVKTTVTLPLRTILAL